MMMRSKRFDSFVSNLVKIQTEEERERMAWDIWLFRRPDLTYQEVLSMFNGENSAPEAQQINTEDLKATIIQSREILNSFCPN